MVEKPDRLVRAAVLIAIALVATTPAQGPAPAAPAAPAVAAPAAPAVTAPAGEPTTADEAALQKKYGDKVKLEAYRAYRALVDGLPPEQQAWERVLEDQLGSYYFPLHLNARIKPGFKPENSEWGFIKDDPALPRVLLIGDSISRSYTVEVRKALAGKANVHRAPANCGPTDCGLKNMDVWLDQGPGKWDIIYFNFGIHDRQKTPEQYTANLAKVIERLKQTGAKLIWARTTPFGSKITEGQDESVALNRVADEVMKKHDIHIDDLHAAVIDKLASAQGDDHTHFNGEGIKLLAVQVVKAIDACLAKP